MLYKFEASILNILKDKKKLSLEDLAKALNTDKNSLMRPIKSLEEKKLITLNINEEKSFELSEEGKRYLEIGLPEVRVYKKALQNLDVDNLSEDERRYGIKFAKENGWIILKEKKLIPIKSLDEKFLEEFNRNYLLSKNEILVKRNLAIEKTIKVFFVSISELGLKTNIEDDKGEALLTAEHIASGEWRSKKFKEYDINVDVKPAEIGKKHPLSIAIDKIRRIFLELGFEEMEGPYIESSFWNFDALFQPQDHPARELADTFYLKKETPLPEDKELINRVKLAHEKGWKSIWKEEEAMKTILRTHTTALSSRYLSKLFSKREGKKYFAVGRVFRNEAIDFKHLAEFHQVEGIIVWEKATFRDLLGILKLFYSKLGFEQIRFRPSYFPYTEPSLEIEVFFKEKNEWIELGGAGIFRPEVSIPLANTYPVLAWGLSLERPLMLMLELNDIRTFYKNDLKWLKTVKVKL